jgi:rhomboid protease GluP
VIGPLIERIYGPLAFAVIYLSAGIGGAIASAVTPPIRVSVGASGAICGVLGALMAFLIVHRRTIPPSVLKLFRSNLLGIVAFMAVLGVVVPNIDQAAHLGGLGMGFVSGLLLSGPWPVVPSRWIAARRLAMTAAIAAGLTGLAFATQWSGPSVADRRLNGLYEQLVTPIVEFNSIDHTISRFKADSDGDRKAAGREEAARVVRELAERGDANLARFHRVTTTDPELRAMADALIRAQEGLIQQVEAEGRFWDTGAGANLVEAHEAANQKKQAIADWNRRRRAYAIRHGLPVLSRPD